MPSIEEFRNNLKTKSENGDGIKPLTANTAEGAPIETLAEAAARLKTGETDLVPSGAHGAEIEAQKATGKVGSLRVEAKVEDSSEEKPKPAARSRRRSS
jgi:hypothetical protein